MIAEIFFRLLNFAVLVTLLGYLFKNYVLQTLKDSMQAQNAVQHALEQERDLLAHRQTIIDQEIVAQEQLREQLVRKVRAWQEHFNEERDKRILEKATLQKQLVEKVDLQKKLYAVDKAQQTIIPHAVESAREQLQKDFENQQKGQAYITTILNSMENA